jgi:hypothetical protein
VIEQLHYTWSERGLQGHGRYQVTAVSPGLADLSGERAALARRLCRQPGGEGPGAVSFGWIDARGYRFVFRRVAAGLTADGRPGRFAAHVLVAPVRVITVPDLLHQPCAEGLWWSGEEEESQSLPRMNPQPLCPWPFPVPGPQHKQGPSDHETALALAHLLDTEGTGHVPGTWPAVLAAAARFSKVIPASFDSVPSFATLEQGEVADWFQLTGTGPRATSAAQPSASARAAAALIMSSHPEGIRMARAAAEATEREGQLRWREFTVLAAAFQSLLAEGSVDCAALLPSLARPGTAGEVLRIRRGRAVVVEALLASQPDVHAALTASARGISHNLLREVGMDLAEGMLAAAPVHQPRAQTLRALLRLGEPLGQHVLDGIAVVALSAPVGDESGWPGEILQACLRSTALKPDRVPMLVKAAAGLDDLAPVLADRGIAVGYRADVAVAALEAGSLSAPSLIQQAGALSELADEVFIRLARSGQASRVLEVISPAEAVLVLTRVAPQLEAHLRLAASQPLWARLSPSARLSLVISLNALNWHGRDDEWSQIADEILTQSVRAQLADTSARLEPDRLIKACSASRRGRAWQRLLVAIAYTAGSPEAAVAGPLRSGSLDRRLSRAYAIHAVLPRAVGQDVGAVLDTLLGRVDPADLQDAVEATERCREASDALYLAREVVIIVACYDTEDEHLLRSCGRLARQHLDGDAWKTLKYRLARASPESGSRLKKIRRLAMYPTVVPDVLQR